MPAMLSTTTEAQSTPTSRHRPHRARRGIAYACVALSLSAALLSMAATSKSKAPAGNPIRSKSKAPADDPIRLNNLGVAYLAQFKPAEAEKQFRQAVGIDPNFVAGQVNVGIAALAQVHYDEAIAAFDRALQLHPDNIHALFNLSLIRKLKGAASEALTGGLKAVQLDPRDPDLNYHVASLYLTLRDYDNAIEKLMVVTKLDPNFLSAYYSLGRAWLAKGDAERGKRFIQKHQELQAGSGATPAVGLRYGEQGRYSFAMEDTSGPAAAAPLEKGAVTFKEVSAAGSGIDFVQGAKGGVELLRRLPQSTPEVSGSPHRAAASLLGGGVAVADVDGDGREDLLFVGSGPAGSTALYMNRGALKFERASGPGAPEPTGAGMSAAFGDLDRDGDPDLVIAMQDRIRVLVNEGGGRFAERTRDSGVEQELEGLPGGVSLADVDHDGDLDIFVAGLLAGAPADKPATGAGARFLPGLAGGKSLLFVNGTVGAGATGGGASSSPQLRFTYAADTAKVEHAGRRATGGVFSDFDNDRDIDFALASPGDGSRIFSNQRDGTFSDLGDASGLPGNAVVLGLVSGDYNKDGWMDLAATTWEGGLPRLFRNVMGDPQAAAGIKPTAFALDATCLADVPRQIGAPQFGLAFLDFDNDGFLDLITINGGDVGPALFVFRNQGDGRFLDAGADVGADQIPSREGRGLAAADLDGDGDLDLVVSNSGAAPTLIRNDGGNKNHWLRVAAAGLHSNKQAIGTKVEVKSGRLWQKLEVVAGSGYLSQSSVIPHFGLGPLARVDTLRFLWPGGVLQDEMQIQPDAVFAVQELDRKGSSCPILYAWNGREIAFVSDFLGGSAIGYRTGPDSFNYPDTDEYVRVTAQQLRAREGMFDLRMVNQLEETIYFDRARLLAVDHPSEYQVYPDERLMPGAPYPRFRLFAVKGARPPEAAWDESGRDMLPAVLDVDRVYAEPPREHPFKGYAPLHSLTVDLGRLPSGAPVVLLLHGWIDYADSTSNLAASQAGMALVAPYLEALDESKDGGDVAATGGRTRPGRWTKVLDPMGFPAGLPKTMTVDLTGKLPEGSRLVRIVTSMRIYWDQILVATDLGGVPTVTAVEASRADLRYRGFPALVEPDGKSPETYDYSRDQAAVHWKSHVGAYTRYGDVKELLGGVDDRYVITRPGDEIALQFPESALPPLLEGHSRDYLLYADGFGKDMDVNSARPSTVTPLPYHAMTAYPPKPGERHPLPAQELIDYLDRYNTRLVRSPLLPLRPR